MSDFLSVSLQNIMHSWQPGLPKVDRKESPLPYISAGGLIFILKFSLKVKNNEYI